MKSFLTSPVIREMQIKTSMRSPHPSMNGYYQKPIEIRQGCGEKGILTHCEWEYK
jgi:hypothetical protein